MQTRTYFDLGNIPLKMRARIGGYITYLYPKLAVHAPVFEETKITANGADDSPDVLQ